MKLGWIIPGDDPYSKDSKMQTIKDTRSYFFKAPPEGKGGAQHELHVDTETRDEPVEHNEFYLCRQCLIIITTPLERIQFYGAHEHTFANPSGIVFQIGCFKRVRGCVYMGPPSDDFTWFKGYSWQVAVCRSCMSHVGWLFTATDRDGFHGLIMDRLILKRG